MRGLALFLPLSFLLAAVPIPGAQATPVCAPPQTWAEACAEAGADPGTATVRLNTTEQLAAFPSNTTTTIHAGTDQDALVRAQTVACGTALDELHNEEKTCTIWSAGAGPGSDGVVRVYECYVWCATVVSAGPGATASADACAATSCHNHVDTAGNVAVNNGVCSDVACLGGAASHDAATHHVAAGSSCGLILTAGCLLSVSGEPVPGGSMTLVTALPGPCPPLLPCIQPVDTITVGVPAAVGDPVSWSHSDCVLGLCAGQGGTVGPGGATVDQCTPAVGCGVRTGQQWVDAQAPPGCSTSITYVEQNGIAEFAQSATPWVGDTCMWDQWTHDITFSGCGSSEAVPISCTSLSTDSSSGAWANLKVYADGTWEVLEMFCTPWCGAWTVVATGTAIRVV